MSSSWCGIALNIVNCSSMISVKKDPEDICNIKKIFFHCILYKQSIYSMFQNLHNGKDLSQNTTSETIHRFKIAILPELKNCQNGAFEPMHEIQKLFWSKDFFWSSMKMTLTKNIANMSQGPPGFRSVKAENWDFFKKDSQDFKNGFQFRFLWIPSKPEKQN